MPFCASIARAVGNENVRSGNGGGVHNRYELKRSLAIGQAVHIHSVVVVGHVHFSGCY
jgi:hypothetical protein